MIVRLTAKLGKKIGVSPTRWLPLHANPYADWSAHLFRAERVQYILITNTASLYSMVMYGRGISDDSTFLNRMTSYIGEFLKDDGHAFIYEKLVVPEMARVSFSKSFNRAVIGSMNDFVFQSKVHLIEGELSPYDVSFRLNETPMSYLRYEYPKRAFTAQQIKGETSNKPDAADGL